MSARIKDELDRIIKEIEKIEKTKKIWITNHFGFGVLTNADAFNWYYHLTDPPNYASYAKNLALSALEAWEDANPGLQFMSQPNRESCLEMRGFTNSCFVMTWAREGKGDNVGYAEGKEILIKGEWIQLPGWHMQVSLGGTIEGVWQPYSDISVDI